MLGASYFDTTAGSILASTATPVGATDPLSPISRVVRALTSKEKAVFASLGGNITDRLRVNAEVRHAELDQDFSGFTALLFLPIPPIVVPSNSQKLTSTTPRLTVDYDIAPGIMLFGSAARGWKAGGFNTAAAPYATYAPETNWSFEVGAKSTLLDGRMILNGAVFYIDWKGLQIPAPIDLVGNTAVVNLGGAKSKGIEIESSFAITPRFNVRVGANFMDPTFNSGVTDGSLFTVCGRRPDSGIIGSPCSIDVGGKQIPKVPKTQLSASTSYTWPQAVLGFDAYARADFSHQSKKFVNSLNTSNAGDIDLLNIRFGLTRDKTEIALWVDNLTDKNWVRSLQSVLDPGINTPCLTRGQNCSAQLLRVYPGDRRTIGITATQRF
jgi:iron complex outermembrane receptor protein